MDRENEKDRGGCDRIQLHLPAGVRRLAKHRLKAHQAAPKRVAVLHTPTADDHRLLVDVHPTGVHMPHIGQAVRAYNSEKARANCGKATSDDDGQNEGLEPTFGKKEQEERCWIELERDRRCKTEYRHPWAFSNVRKVEEPCNEHKDKHLHVGAVEREENRVGQADEYDHPLCSCERMLIPIEDPATEHYGEHT